MTDEELYGLFADAHDLQVELLQYMESEGIPREVSAMSVSDVRYLTCFDHHEDYMTFLEHQRAARIATGKYLRAIGQKEKSDEAKARAGKTKAKKETPELAT